MLFESPFGSKIKELRKSRGISQKQLADYLGVTPTQISDIENAKTSTSFRRAIALATFFNVSLDYLAGFTEQKGTSDIESLYNSLSHDQQMKVLGYIDSLKNN